MLKIELLYSFLVLGFSLMTLLSGGLLHELNREICKFCGKRE
jgi:hypothetical protein